MKRVSSWIVAASIMTLVSSAIASDLRSLTATYRVERKQNETSAASYEWKLHRSPSCVVAYDDRAQVSEQWHRDSEGRIWYKRIFHKEKKVIEYQPADLGIGGIEAKWTRLGSVIEPAELESMTLQNQAAQFDGRPVAVYSGTRQRQPWEVWWLGAEQIPVRISVGAQGSGSGYYSLELLALSYQNPDSITCKAELSGYETIDFADIGDRQGDPFITALMKYEGLVHGHGH